MNYRSHYPEVSPQIKFEVQTNAIDTAKRFVRNIESRSGKLCNNVELFDATEPCQSLTQEGQFDLFGGKKYTDDHLPKISDISGIDFYSPQINFYKTEDNKDFYIEVDLRNVSYSSRKRNRLCYHRSKNTGKFNFDHIVEKIIDDCTEGCRKFNEAKKGEEKKAATENAFKAIMTENGLSIEKANKRVEPGHIFIEKPTYTYQAEVKIYFDMDSIDHIRKMTDFIAMVKREFSEFLQYAAVEEEKKEDDDNKQCS